MSVWINILTWLIFGSAIAGLAYIIEPSMRNRYPFILGISGAAVAGILGNYIFNIPLAQFSLMSFTVALCGACFLVVTTGFLRNI